MRLAMFNQKKSRDLDISTQLSFLNRLAKLLQRNRSMRDALEFMTYDPQLGQIAKRFVSELQTGTTIPESFRRMKFQPLVVSFLFLSSETGHFSDHLIQLNRLLLMRQEFEKRLKQLLRYPLFLLLICMLLIIMLNSFL